MFGLAVAVASATGRLFNPVAGETRVSTANWYIAKNAIEPFVAKGIQL